jgi:circadian clock protein KaiC
VDGNPGAGKTTLALQYLLEGLRNGERCLYVTLSETQAELVAGARSHGWTLDGLDIRELVASARCCCWTTAPPRARTCSCRASPTA